VFAFKSCDPEGVSCRETKQKLIWQPIDPEDFKGGTGVDGEELRRFRESLHPWRENRSMDLFRTFEAILAVGRCFSLGVLVDHSEVWIFRNSTGDADKLFVTE